MADVERERVRAGLAVRVAVGGDKERVWVRVALAEPLASAEWVRVGEHVGEAVWEGDVVQLGDTDGVGEALLEADIAPETEGV